VSNKYPWLQKTQPRGQILYDLLAPYLKDGDKILDVACGYSPMAKQLIQAGYAVSGFDTDAEVIKALKETYPTGNWIHGSYESLEYRGYTVLVMLGITKTPHSEDNFKDWLRRLIEKNEFHTVLLEVGDAPPEYPRFQLYIHFIKMLMELGYSHVAAGEYDATLDMVSKRIYSILRPSTDDYLPACYYDERFRDPKFCRGQEYVRRNQALIELVRDLKFTRVFEFGGASGLLAEMMLRRFSQIEYYLFSDLSPRACRLAEKNLAGYRVEIRPLDMTRDLDKVNWDTFDLVVTTSLEHLPRGVDLEILDRIRAGTHVLFSLTRFKKRGHPHPFVSEEYIRNRFEGRLMIHSLVPYPPLQVFLMHGTVK